MKTRKTAPFVFGFLSVMALSSLAQAQTVLVNAPPPFPQSSMGDTNFQILYLGNASGTPTSGSVPQGFRFINTTPVTNSNPENLIYLDVSTSQNFTLKPGNVIAVTLTTMGAGSEVKLSGAGIAAGTSAPPSCAVSGNCFPIGLNGAAYYTAGSVLRVSFSLDNLCVSMGTSPFCSSLATMNNATYTMPMKVTFGVVGITATNASDVTNSTMSANNTFIFGITDPK